jgi:hypothetical protein
MLHNAWQNTFKAGILVKQNLKSPNLLTLMPTPKPTPVKNQLDSIPTLCFVTLKALRIHFGPTLQMLIHIRF